MNSFMQKVQQVGLLPLIVLDDTSKAIPLGEALVESGIPFAEVTFRTDNAAEVIKEMAKVKGLHVGAGTVHNVEQAKLAYENGATFIVTPGIFKDVVVWCQEHQLPIVPGCVVPSDIELALDLGLEVVKFFPAEAYGGISTLKALSGPYKNVKFIPTGGVNEKNFTDYLALDNVFAVGGSFVPPASLIKQEKYDDIVSLGKTLRQEILNFSIGHVGIHPQGNDQAKDITSLFSNLLALPNQETPTSYFVSDLIEIMKEPVHGHLGHICIDTDDFTRAVAYFEDHGLVFKEGTQLYNAQGECFSQYLEQEVAGYAVQLRKRP